MARASGVSNPASSSSVRERKANFPVSSIVKTSAPASARDQWNSQPSCPSWRAVRDTSAFVPFPISWHCFCERATPSAVRKTRCWAETAGVTSYSS